MESTDPIAQQTVHCARGPLSAEVRLRPLRVDLRRAGRRVLHGLTAWAAEGICRDRFLPLTEGVIPGEDLERVERVAGATVSALAEDRIELDLRFDRGRAGRLAIALLEDGSAQVDLSVDGDPLRVGLEWAARNGEAFAGLGARHHPHVDHAGRTIQLGADRAYTGPDCPPDVLEVGGIPQGDYAPAPWLQSSRGYALWLDTHGNGVQFALDDPVGVSVRAASGPLRLRVLTDPTPAGRLRRYLRLTGLPALLPEWGYGYWKSRDVYEHQEDVEEDFHGCRWHRIPLDALVLDSPWETQYNTWEPNPHQFPDFRGMVARLRASGVRTVVWVTPWVNVDSLDAQVPPDPGSRRLHREPAANYEEGEREGHYVRRPDGQPLVARWWMGRGSPVDLLAPRAERWWREQAKRVLELGVEGIKADDGEGYYLPDDARLAGGRRTGADAAWALGGAYRRSMRLALEEVHPGRGVLFGRCGWAGQQSDGVLWAGDQASDFWSLRVLVACTLAAAGSGFSNWSHDVGGYLGWRGIHRCPRELLVRWVQLGCFTPLMQAHARLQQEPWTYDPETLALYRAYVLLHERLVPYVRAAAATARRAGVPIVRPLHLMDPADARGWTIADAFGYGPALWVAPVLEEGATEREVPLPRGDWIETWSGATVRGGGEVVAPAPLDRIPVWVRRGSVVVTYPAEHVAGGLGDVPEGDRPLEATLWGEPPLGRTAARLADGTRVGWDRRRGWSIDRDREVTFAERA